ncbi:MAG: hypothetical protein ACJASQ_001596 [Crocinitomicaceae bacterium]|jgi:hypothetical protein
MKILSNQGSEELIYQRLSAAKYPVELYKSWMKLGVVFRFAVFNRKNNRRFVVD